MALRHGDEHQDRELAAEAGHPAGLHIAAAVEQEPGHLVDDPDPVRARQRQDEIPLHGGRLLRGRIAARVMSPSYRRGESRFHRASPGRRPRPPSSPALQPWAWNRGPSAERMMRAYPDVRRHSGAESPGDGDGTDLRARAGPGPGRVHRRAGALLPGGTPPRARRRDDPGDAPARRHHPHGPRRPAPGGGLEGAHRLPLLHVPLRPGRGRAIPAAGQSAGS
jgi:hypothetical protein